jgi:16S rRNA (cytosine1402-N4)-methyltransferase
MSRVYQALRLRVNDELGEIDRLIARIADWIVPGGRFVAISYESLSDRRLKALHRRHAEGSPAPFRLMTSHVIRPDRDEIRMNPRARSAKLRALERIGA